MSFFYKSQPYTVISFCLNYDFDDDGYIWFGHYPGEKRISDVMRGSYGNWQQEDSNIYYSYSILLHRNGIVDSSTM